MQENDKRKLSQRTPEMPQPAPTFAASALAEAARRAADHFGGNDTEAGPDGTPERIELWGCRIGRGLSLAACIALGIYLYLTYLR